jgi:hypothetical protein
MKTNPSSPSFAARPLKIGGEWIVVVTWSNGSQESIPGFGSGSAAFQWIEQESEDWLVQRLLAK